MRAGTASGLHLSSLAVTLRIKRKASGEKSRALSLAHCSLPINNVAPLSLFTGACPSCSGIMDRDFWTRACSAARSRPLSELQQANFGAGIVAVIAWFHRLLCTLSHDPIHSACPFLLSGYTLCVGCRGERYLLRAAAQATALEAARVGGGGGPDMEASGTIQRLDVRWLRCGRRRICSAHACIHNIF